MPHDLLRLLDASITHRGGDGAGAFTDSVTRGGVTIDLALLHRRMAVIDPQGGAQPMARSLPDGNRIAISFNGCIYNHAELRNSLDAAGFDFASHHSDTEALLLGWAYWGAGAFSRARGMFAAALWDAASGTLSLARDDAGEKPLYTLSHQAPDAHWFLFASTAAALAKAAAYLGGPPHRSAAAWLRGWSSGSGYEGIEELPPRSLLSIGPDGNPTTSVWARHPGPSTPLTEHAAERMLEASVQQRLEADVPLGCFLSGGVDSGLVAAFAQRALAARGQQLRTFTMRIDDPALDESRLAELTAKKLGTQHTTLECGAAPADDLRTLISRLGVPLGDSSLLPSYWLCKAARTHIRVALCGDGGDEVFLGYDRHAAFAHLQRFGPLLRHAPLALASLCPARRRERARRFLLACRHGYDALRWVFDTRDLADLLRGAAPRPDPAATPRTDLDDYLPFDLLRKMDTASMAVALEVRSPFLDPALVAAARATPAGVLMPGNRRKGLLRAVAARHLPPEVLNAPKRGFAVPVGAWFRADTGGMRTLLQEAVSDAAVSDALAAPVRAGAVARLLREHDAGRRDHGQRLYMLLVLCLWAGIEK